MNDLNKSRLLELLADQSLLELSQEEKAELAQLENKFTDLDLENDFSFELAATAINLSELETIDEMPASLRTKIIADAEDFFAANKVPSAGSVNTENNYPAFENTRRIIETDAPRPFWQWLGWAFAGAACLALAVNLWLTRGKPQPEIVQNPPVIQTPTPSLPPEQQRTQMLATAADVLKVPLANPKNDKEVLGEMVWSNSLQKGYIRFNNLPPNDANKETYQLWIVDEGQNQKTPVNGGVFDITRNGEAIIPVDPELKIKKPLVFAVTVEKPGGVVVSAQEKVVAFAKV